MSDPDRIDQINSDADDLDRGDFPDGTVLGDLRDLWGKS